MHISILHISIFILKKERKKRKQFLKKTELDNISNSQLQLLQFGITWISYQFNSTLNWYDVHIILLFYVLLLKEVSLSVINKLYTLSSELQINFSELQIDTENSAAEVAYDHFYNAHWKLPLINKFLKIKANFFKIKFFFSLHNWEFYLFIYLFVDSISLSFFTLY